MEFRLRASPEQFAIMLDFMETNGDLSRPQPGAEGRLRAERQWNELTEVLNSVERGVQKQTNRWKRVWSDWKTKTKKKAAIVNKETQGTGGGPNRARPLNALEDRVLRIIIGLGSITGHEEVQEAGFDVPPASELVTVRTILSPLRSDQPLAPSVAEVHPVGPNTGQSLELHPVTESKNIEVPDVVPTHSVPEISNTDAGQSLSAPSPSAPSPPRHRLLIGQSRRRHQTPFEQATVEFVKIEETRLRLEETRMLKEHERDMEQLRVEALRVEMEQSRNNILQKIADTMELLLQSQHDRD